MTTTKGEITERENIRNVAGKRRFIRQMDRQIGIGRSDCDAIGNCPDWLNDKDAKAQISQR